jgi:Stage II sporulation protein E (SpoIIE)
LRRSPAGWRLACYALQRGVRRFESCRGHQPKVLVIVRHSRRNADDLPEVDAAIAGQFGHSLFATGLLGRLDVDTGRLRWIKAGHPARLIVRGSAVVHPPHSRPTHPLGLQEVTPPCCGTRLEPADRLLLCTDGIVEARSPDSEFVGQGRLADVIKAAVADGEPAPETVRRLLRRLLAREPDQLQDDASTVILEWRSEREQRRLVWQRRRAEGRPRWANRHSFGAPSKVPVGHRPGLCPRPGRCPCRARTPSVLAAPVGTVGRALAWSTVRRAVCAASGWDRTGANPFSGAEEAGGSAVEVGSCGMLMWPIVSLVGFAALTAVIVVLGTGSTSRYEAERQPVASDAVRGAAAGPDGGRERAPTAA